MRRLSDAAAQALSQHKGDLYLYRLTSLSDAAAVMPRWSQCLRNVRVVSKDLTGPVREAVERLNGQLDGSGRVLVRASGTEPLIRVLAEAENGQVAQEACASLAALVEKELG